jgi:hypothetical protein
MYYNKLTTQSVQSLTPNILKSKVKNPQPLHYENEGWILSPIQEPTIHDNTYILSNTKRIVLIDNLPHYEYDYETEEEREARLNQIKQQTFHNDAMQLHRKLIEKYTTFVDAYQQTIHEVKEINPDIPTNIDYPSLINALMILDGEIWIKKSFALQMLWNDVVVASRKTPSEAFELLPMMEYRRLNPPAIEEPIEDDIIG